MKKNIYLSLQILFIYSFTTPALTADIQEIPFTAPTTTVKTSDIPPLKAPIGAWIDWEKRLIYVTGKGIVRAEQKSRFHESSTLRLLGERSAMVNAYRNLAALIYGLHIDKTTTVDEYGKKHVTLQQTVSGTLSGAKKEDLKIREQENGDILFEVKISYPLEKLEKSLNISNRFKVPHQKLIFHEEEE